MNEWCWDHGDGVEETCGDCGGSGLLWKSEYYAVPPPVSDPLGPVTGSSRIVRGGAWNSLAVDCRVSCRRQIAPDTVSAVIGFRIVRSAGVE